MEIKAVKPYIYPGLNFKDKAFEAWRILGYAIKEGWYPRWLHAILFRYDIFPTLWRGEARLIFVQPVSLFFDAGSEVLCHEVIPLIWDCWPQYYDRMEHWLRRHKVRKALFTSTQEMIEIQRRLPNLQTIHCPEAIDTAAYIEGKPLCKRTIDIFEFGRANNIITGLSNIKSINHVNTANSERRFNDKELRSMLAEARLCICFPKSMTHPEEAQGVETLTQRYWEAMASRALPIGHCPQELIDLIGYNPVIEYENNEQILQILNHIELYQPLVDKNRYIAITQGDWRVRLSRIHHEISLP